MLRPCPGRDEAPTSGPTTPQISVRVGNTFADLREVGGAGCGRGAAAALQHTFLAGTARQGRTASRSACCA